MSPAATLRVRVRRVRVRAVRRHPARLVALCTALTVVAGCGSGAAGDDAGTSSSAAPLAGCSTESTVNAMGASLLPIPPAAVTLIDAGAQPTAVATGSPDLARAQNVRLVTTSASSSTSQGQPRSDTAQTVDLPLTARTLCTDPTDVELELGAASSPDPDLSRSLAAVRDSKAGLAVAGGSVPISLRIVPAQAADDAARSAVEQSLVQALQRSVTLPREPIGVGARWRAVRTIVGAATVTQTITATLRERVGDTLTVDVQVEEEPVDSVFRIPGSTQTLTIASFSMSGTGSMTIDLSRGLPSAGELTVRGGRSLVGADPARPLVQQTSTAIRWETIR
ncbi:hypothetical protein [Williamsia phyllosphaerae]|uniref:Lipoprotein n=1 Tax=Williamsia phyllosphaerae TaxID=885042 RepID=A0ABQ1UZT1_9NOCA|nr:hypothetical protein [Williamsia phyllosphaerae]GGF29646.1 hypothetical protein GCM10007298_26990 [Williamsia phyllosphaerae]